MPFKWRGRYVCFYCGENNSQYCDFREHTKTHGDCTTKDYSLRVIKGSYAEIKVDVSEVSCAICQEPFPNVHEIIDHLIEKHKMLYDTTIDIPYQEYRLNDLKCLVCEKQFRYFGTLVNHMNNVHPKNEFICDDCGATFNKKRDLAGHIRLYHRPGGYPCRECHEKFVSFAKLRNHQNRSHFSRCKNCNLTFQNYTFLQKHMLADHPKNRGITSCVHCSKKFHSAQGLTLHINKCKVRLIKQENLQPPKPLDSKQIECATKQNLKQIRANIQYVLNMSTAVPFKFFSKFTCFFCSKKFDEFEDLKGHTMSEHPVCETKSKCMKKCRGEKIIVKIDVAKLACKLCSLPMSDLEELIDHLIDAHNADYDKSIKCFEVFRLVKDNIPCPICKSIFRYFGLLLRHMNAEHNNNNVICDICGRSFKKVTNLKVHMLYFHVGACDCDACGAHFNNRWCLSRHKAKYHNAKEHKCPKCPELFESNYKKAKHMIKAHGTGHECVHCKKMFTRNSFMKNHVRRTHFKERNVACTLCSENFFDNYSLKMHMVKHDGERRFACDVCGKAFLRRSNLNSHMDMHKKYGHMQ